MSIIIIALVSALWLWLLTRQPGDVHRTRAIVLAVPPVALLFLTIPPVVSATRMISGFQRVAKEGAGGFGAVAPFVSGVSRSLLWGAWGLLATMLAAAALQVQSLSRAEDTIPTEDTPEPSSRPLSWILVIGSLLLIPVSVYAYLGGRLPGLVINAALTAQQGAVAGSKAAEITRTIASALVSAVAGGAILSLVLGAFAVAGLVVSLRARPATWLFTYSWAILAAVVALACSGILHASIDLRSVERLTQ